MNKGELPHFDGRPREIANQATGLSNPQLIHSKSCDSDSPVRPASGGLESPQITRIKRRQQAWPAKALKLCRCDQTFTLPRGKKALTQRVVNSHHRADGGV